MNAPHPNVFLHHALDYARRGFPVFHCDPSTKRPLTQRGFKDATRDENQISEWWERHPAAMIGVPTGPDSGTFAIDVDVPKRPGEPDGRAAWSELVTAHGTPINTHSHETPSGGQHLLFRWRADRPVTNRRGGLPDGIDVRGAGGYIIVPPSRRADGEIYRIAPSTTSTSRKLRTGCTRSLRMPLRSTARRGQLSSSASFALTSGTTPMRERLSWMNATRSPPPGAARATKH
jgi:Bifunctional DNA primase/polymerase, N-terminal